MDVVDAVVIGSGPNGLVAANHLADAGWSVLVLESRSQVGGAVASSRDVHPRYVHDTFSSFYPLAAASPTIQALELEKHGLAWSHAPAVVGTPFASGQWALLHHDVAETAAALDALTPGDGEAWLRTYADWERIGEQVVSALMSPFPPVRHGLAAAARLPRVGGMAFVRAMLAPARVFVDEMFRGQPAKMLIAGNSGHADIPVDSPGSGFFGWLLCMLAQQHGFPVPVGGAGMLAEAMARRFRSLGGEIRLDTRVDRVVVEGGRARAVRTKHGDEVRVRRAVIADVAATALYGGLVPWDDLPGSLHRRMRHFQWDPGTVKVDWALDGPVPWESPPAAEPGTVHLAEDVNDIATSNAQIAAGTVPGEPFLLVGQMAAADRSRAPAGSESVWAYTHVPQHTRHDAGDDGITGTWDASECERFADRMQARIEHYAPGFAGRVVARRVLGPRELEARDENLVGGALNGGTAALHQQLVFRPVPGLGRAETPVAGLYLGSASAHPGGGVHGACGMNAARAALGHARLRGPWRGTARP
jgi:phytoene dehydrogenase-like protein